MARRPPEDGRIGSIFPIGAGGGEADQQIAAERIQLGVLWPGGGGGANGIGGQVGIDQNGSHLFGALAWIEIRQVAVALQIGRQLSIIG